MATQADKAWFDLYLANQDQALVPNWMKPDSPNYLYNWHNITGAANSSTASGLPEPVYVKMNGRGFIAHSGVTLSSWIERGAVICTSADL